MSSSLADELLGDLEEDEAGHLSHVISAQDATAEENDGWGLMQQDLNGDDDDNEDEDDEVDAGLDDEVAGNGSGNEERSSTESMRVQDIDAMDLRPEIVGSIGDVCTLMLSARMKSVMLNVGKFSALDKPDIEGVLEDSPEYQLIVQANNLAVDVDNEIMIVHKFIRQHYKIRFPELESLVAGPWEFVQAVRAIGNQENLAKAKLDGILPHGTVVVISMQASTTKGRTLSPEAWQRVDEACTLIFQLDEARRKIQQYVESRMSIIAPNLSKVVGSRVATKLLGVAGGLTALTKIPACNVMLLGASKSTAAGMSTAFSGRHKGFIVQAPLIERTPQEYHRQAMRIVSAKALLAARVDAGASDRHGTYGARLAQELEQKLDKLQEPPPNKIVKALPVPKEGGNKQRRGGRRARKIKERLGMSDVRKMQNRLRFGETAEEEAGAFDETVGMGMLDAKGGETGRLRALAANNATKTRMSKRNTQRINAIQQGGNAASRLREYEQDGQGSNSANGLSTANAPYGRRHANGANTEVMSGTASSLAFTPVQGIELVDPSHQRRKVDEANAKWFKEGMFSLAPGAKSSSSSSSILPGLPSSSTLSSSKKQRLE